MRFGWVLIAFILGAFAIPSFSQIICKTSTTPNLGSICQNEYFEPVCGCDSITYRNPCDAVKANNVQFYQSGTCNIFPFALDLFPTPFSSTTPLRLAIQTKSNTVSSFSILIWDSYGILQLSRNILLVNRFDWLIDAYNFKSGVYIISVTSTTSGYSERRKIVVAGT